MPPVTAEEGQACGTGGAGGIDALVRRLGDAVARGEVQEAEETLSLLREGYRADPSGFAPGAIDEIRRFGGRMRLRRALKDSFGYGSFRPGQEEVIQAVMSNRDALAVMPTGSGKSLLYQLPAHLLGGATLVVSPLISLQKDQVDALNEGGIRATFLNSSLSPEMRRQRMHGLRNGEYELVYAAPEGLEQGLGALMENVDLKLMAVDEAHCISHWGHDFRPSYRNLAHLKGRLGKIPVLALTATATAAVADDIVEQLGMLDPFMYRGSFFRPNLHIHAIRKGGGQTVRDSILQIVKAHGNESGIVYCMGRRTVDSTADFLKRSGIRAEGYHAGMDAAAREAAQEAFRRDGIDVVVATIAFGMGIDKSNVRYVVHRDMPKSIEGYSQEIGRAGRDGEPSDCILFYSWADVLALDRFTRDLEPELAEAQREQIRRMYGFAQGPSCRHQALAMHFNEKIDPCGASCDRCTGRDALLDGHQGARRQIGQIGQTDQAGRAHRTGQADGARRTDQADRAEGAPEKGKAAPAHGPHEPHEPGADGPLFEELRKLRKRIADERGLPAYIVFADSALKAMAARRPQTEDGLLSIPGVGNRKLEQYGELFLDVLRNADGRGPHGTP
jgi:ATP-dependent DNA helicase RecQ